MSAAGLRAGLEGLPLHVDLALPGELPGALRGGQRGQLGAGVDAERHPGRPGIGQPLQRGLPGQAELLTVRACSSWLPAALYRSPASTSA